jgi:hypothetical protein
MRPETDDLDCFNLNENLIDETVLNADPPRKSAGQVSDQLLEWGRALIRILGQKGEKGLAAQPAIISSRPATT